MNCFNIKEAQTLLKQKFLFDTSSTNWANDFFDNSNLRLRFSLNDNSYTNNSELSYSYSLATIKVVNPFITRKQLPVVGTNLKSKELSYLSIDLITSLNLAGYSLGDTGVSLRNLLGNHNLNCFLLALDLYKNTPLVFSAPTAQELTVYPYIRSLVNGLSNIIVLALSGTTNVSLKTNLLGEQ